MWNRHRGRHHTHRLQQLQSHCSLQQLQEPSHPTEDRRLSTIQDDRPEIAEHQRIAGKEQKTSKGSGKKQGKSAVHREQSDSLEIARTQILHSLTRLQRLISALQKEEGDGIFDNYSKKKKSIYSNHKIYMHINQLRPLKSILSILLFKGEK